MLKIVKLKRIYLIELKKNNITIIQVKITWTLLNKAWKKK